MLKALVKTSVYFSGLFLTAVLSIELLLFIGAGNQNQVPSGSHASTVTETNQLGLDSDQNTSKIQLEYVVNTLKHSKKANSRKFYPAFYLLIPE